MFSHVQDCSDIKTFLFFCDLSSQSPLHLAIRDNSLEIIDILLAFGADPSIKDRRGNSSLHIAAAARATEALKILLKHARKKEDINKLNDYGESEAQPAQNIIKIL